MKVTMFRHKTTSFLTVDFKLNDIAMVRGYVGQFLPGWKIVTYEA